MRDNNKGRVKKFKGFTLIEIIVVITIIGLMATLLITLVNPAKQFQKSNDAKRKADLHQIQAVLELYRSDQGQYPAALPACGSALTAGTTTYLQKVPCDPKNTGQFQYQYTSPTASTYSLIACLENVTDPQKDATNAPNTSGGTYCNGTSAWSYTLINP